MKDKTVLCPECQNTTELENEIRVGDIVECPHCGSELRVADFDSDGKILVKVIQEEK